MVCGSARVLFRNYASATAPSVRVLSCAAPFDRITSLSSQGRIRSPCAHCSRECLTSSLTRRKQHGLILLCFRPDFYPHAAQLVGCPHLALSLAKSYRKGRSPTRRSVAPRTRIAGDPNHGNPLSEVQVDPAYRVEVEIGGPVRAVFDMLGIVARWQRLFA